VVLLALLFIPLFLFLEDFLGFGRILNNSFTPESGFALPMEDGDVLLLRGENRMGHSFFFSVDACYFYAGSFSLNYLVYLLGCLAITPSPPASPPPAGREPRQRMSTGTITLLAPFIWG
jgi:hypothetical protein